MRVLSIGTDRKLFEDGSAVRERQSAYAENLGEMDIIIFNRGTGMHALRFDTVTLNPTNSKSRWMYGFDAWYVARKLPKPDVITSQDPFETGLASLFIARMFRVPLHVQVHTDFTATAFSRHSFLNWMRVRIAWFVLRRASRIRVILQKTADEIRKKGITVPATVLPIFVDSKNLSTVSRIKHPRWKIALLAIGRFEKEKNFELAIEALSEAREKGHDIGLTLIGEGALRQYYYRYAQQMRVADRLELVGWQNDTARFYSEADLVLVTSKYEGYGLVIVEALSAGIPVLSTDVGVAREAGAIVVSAKEYAKSLLKWIADGPRKGNLTISQYKDFDEYVERYCADIRATH